MSNEKPIEEVAERVAVKSDKKLRKALSFQDLFFLSMGGIIGSGWLLGVAAGASVAGPASVLSWIIGGIIVLFIALVFAEISAAIPKSGSIVRYPHLAYGGYAGYILSWAYLLSAVTVPTIEA
ncbi:MAG: APC family permease, partial [Thermoplasmata archaeon]